MPLANLSCRCCPGSWVPYNQKELDKLNDRYNELSEKIDDKQQKLLEANQQLALLKDKNDDLEIQVDTAERKVNALVKEMANDTNTLAHGAIYENFYPALRALLGKPEELKAILGDNSILEGIDTGAMDEIAHKAIDAFIYAISGGENVRVGIGGGGGSSDDDWWRKKDPNETHAALMRYCMSHSIKSYKAVNGVKRTR